MAAGSNDGEAPAGRPEPPPFIHPQIAKSSTSAPLPVGEVPRGTVDEQKRTQPQSVLNSKRSFIGKSLDSSRGRRSGRRLLQMLLSIPDLDHERTRKERSDEFFLQLQVALLKFNHNQKPADEETDELPDDPSPFQLGARAKGRPLSSHSASAF